jgi:hypothetical protein
MMMAMWRGKVLVLADILPVQCLIFGGFRPEANATNDEARMTNDERILKPE